jgi:sigma-B regulation protein RsbU (phosphoserine phosphatase)
MIVSLAIAYGAHLFHLASEGRRFAILRIESIKKTVEFETEKVNKIIAGLEQNAIVVANNGLLFYQSQSHNVGESLLLNYLRNFPDAIASGFWFEPYAYNKDTLRTGIWATRDKDDVRIDIRASTDKYDYHDREWYLEIVKAIKEPYKVVWTKPYIDDNDPLVVTAGAGIYDDGKLIGVSTIDWEIETVIKELTAIKPTENSFVLLCVPEQDYIISSTRTNSVIGASIKSLPYDVNADYFTFAGTLYLRFGVYMDNGWLLSIQIPRHEIFSEGEERVKHFLVIFAIIALINLFITYFLTSKFINKPIKQLISGVSKFTFGHLDTRIEMKSKDELGQLANIFNNMASDLHNAIEANARERAEKERLGAELGVAAQIQAGMLPCIFPPFPDRNEFDIYASMLPAKEVGGDFYDFFFVNKNTLAVVIADVSGKGVPAALFMVIAKTLIKNNACSGKKPKEVFETVNSVLNENNDAFMFVTAFMGYYNIRSGKFVYVNAGHNPPLVKKRNGNYEFLKTTPHFFLAWNKDAKYTEEEITLDSGDVLYLYTDGVTEAVNKDNELFSEQRLLDVLNKYEDFSPKELLHIVKREIDSFAEEAEQADDITMLALKANGATEERVKKMEVEAAIENLDEVFDFINAELQDCPPELRNDIDIVIEEVFVNIANYAYKPNKGKAAISISAGQKITIKIEDKGEAYNPLEHEDPDLDKPLMEREIGGLGILMVKKLMDNVEYMRIENKNVLIMTKKLPGGELYHS